MGDWDCPRCGLPGWTSGGGVRGFTTSSPVCKCSQLGQSNSYSYEPVSGFDLWKKSHPRVWRCAWVGLVILGVVIAPVVLGAAVFFGFKLLMLILEIFFTAINLYEP
jgi:hypothetical protein